MNPLIITASATSEEIIPVVNLLESTLTSLDVNPSHAIIAMLSIIFILQHPDITAEELQTAVQDTSQHICLSIDSMESTIPATSSMETLN